MRIQQLLRRSALTAILTCLAVFAVEGIVYSQTAWTLVPGISRYVSEMHFRDRNVGFVLVGYPGNNTPDSLMKTVDGGLTSVTVALPVSKPYHISDFYLYHDTVWVACETKMDADKSVRLLRSTDVGETWTVLPFDTAFHIKEICFSSATSGYLWATSPDSIFANPWTDSIYYTSDGGSSWKAKRRGGYINHIKTGYSSTLFATQPAGGQSYNIALRFSDYADSITYLFHGEGYSYAGDRVWIAADGRSTDDGATWTSASAPSFDYFLLFAYSDTTGDAYSPKWLDDDSVYYTHDRGVSWKVGAFVKGGSPYYFEVIDSLYAYAASWKGIFKTITGGIGELAGANEPQPPATFEMHPNPTGGTISITGAPPNLQRVVVTNMLGITVVELSRPAGSEFTLDISKLPSGTYFVRFITPDGVMIRKVLKE